MNSLVPSNLNFRLYNLLHLNSNRPYFQFRWIGILVDQNPLVSILFYALLPFLSGFLRGSKGNRSATIRKTFLEFFSPFFSQLITPFNHAHSLLLSKADANVQPLIPYFQIYWKVFSKVFSKAILTLYFNSLSKLSATLLPKWSAKVQNDKLQFKAFSIKI